MFKWGVGKGLDYPTAVRRGEVPMPERRAVEMLRRQCDPERFRYYCHTGHLPARGNVTGTIYLVRKGGGAMELCDGREVASWCISIGPHRPDLPPTDHAAVLKAMIEGEEPTFVRTGNRAGYMGNYIGGSQPRSDGGSKYDPYRTVLLMDDHPLAVRLLRDRAEGRAVLCESLKPVRSIAQIGGQGIAFDAGEIEQQGGAGINYGVGNYADATFATQTANTTNMDFLCQNPTQGVGYVPGRRRRAQPQPRQAFPPNAVVRGVGRGLYELV